MQQWDKPMRYKKCKVCHLKWNVSIKANLSKPYECPECEEKRVEAIKPTVVNNLRRKSEGRISYETRTSIKTQRRRI